jgi:hypothetical protein
MKILFDAASLRCITPNLNDPLAHPTRRPNLAANGGSIYTQRPNLNDPLAISRSGPFLF